MVLTSLIKTSLKAKSLIKLFFSSRIPNRTEGIRKRYVSVVKSNGWIMNHLALAALLFEMVSFSEWKVQQLQCTVIERN